MYHKLKKISIVITDIDGVWTDGGMYYDENGNEQKKFNTRDGMGVERLRDHGIETVICTSENSNIVIKRAEKLRIEKVYIGIKDKGQFFDLFCKENTIEPDLIAYIGDDLNDLKIMEKAGFTSCPSDAFEKIKNISDYVCNSNGGGGAFREFAELILDS